jgi:hypothetical protein
MIFSRKLSKAGCSTANQATRASRADEVPAKPAGSGGHPSAAPPRMSILWANS